MNDQTPSGHQSLAELIASRLCHDLVNPLGAIGNGVELIEMTGAVRGPEMALIRDAVRDAQARVRFLRIAFGAAAPTQLLSTREAKATAQGPWQGARLHVSWAVAEDLPRHRVKIGYLMLLCAETALPMGGDVTIAQAPGGHLRLSAKASRITLDPDAKWPWLLVFLPIIIAMIAVVVGLLAGCVQRPSLDQRRAENEIIMRTI